MSDNNLLNENPVLYLKKKRENAFNEMPVLMESGHNLIYSELCEGWDKLVRSSVSSLYCGDEVKAALKIMASLCDGDSMAEAIETYNHLNDGSGFESSVLNIVRNFSKKGPEFWLSVASEEVSVEDLRTLIFIQKRNNAFERQVSNHK